MSHTSIEDHKGYMVHGTSEKHDTGKWIGSFHVAVKSVPRISVSLVNDAFGTAEEAASHALYQGKMYIDRELS